MTPHTSRRRWCVLHDGRTLPQPRTAAPSPNRAAARAARRRRAQAARLPIPS